MANEYQHNSRRNVSNNAQGRLRTTFEEHMQFSLTDLLRMLATFGRSNTHRNIPDP